MTSALRVLVPTDLSPASLLVLPVARRLGEVTVLHVLPGHPDEARLGEAREELERVLAESASNLTVLVDGGHAARQIVAATNGFGFDLVVMSSHGRTGLARLLLGSVADKVMRLTGCPVMLLKNADAVVGVLERQPRLLLAVDVRNGERSEQLEHALRWAEQLGGVVDLCNVVEVPPARAELYAEARREARGVLESLLSEVPVAHRGQPVLLAGAPREELVAAAEAAALVVVGSHGRERIERTILGSVSDGVARLAPAVAVVPTFAGI